MSAISTEHENKFGTTCRWLDFDSSCHMTKCVLNWARREILFEAFQDLNLKHPEFAYEIFSEDCSKMHGDYKCFSKEKKPEVSLEKELIDDECYLTELEDEAMKIAKEELKDESKVKEMYWHGKLTYIEKEKKRLEDEMTRFKEIELENEV